MDAKINAVLKTLGCGNITLSPFIVSENGEMLF